MAWRRLDVSTRWRFCQIRGRGVVPPARLHRGMYCQTRGRGFLLVTTGGYIWLNRLILVELTLPQRAALLRGESRQMPAPCAARRAKADLGTTGGAGCPKGAFDYARYREILRRNMEPGRGRGRSPPLLPPLPILRGFLRQMPPNPPNGGWLRGVLPGIKPDITPGGAPSAADAARNSTAASGHSTGLGCLRRP